MLQFILNNIKTPNDLHLYTLAKRNSHACKLVYRHFRKNPAKASETQANFLGKVSQQALRKDCEHFLVKFF